MGTKLAGTGRIGKGTGIGIGVSGTNNISICPDCMVGASGVVIRKNEKGGTYVGVPVERSDMKEKFRGGGKII